jgi:hypothetical protein
MFRQDGDKIYYTSMLLRWVQNGTMELSEIEELVNRGADVDTEEDYIHGFYGGKRSVIISAIITNIKNHGKHNQIVQYLLSKGAKINAQQLNVALDVTKQEGYTIEVDEFRKNMKE